MGKIESVDQYLESHPKWKKELTALREVFLSYNLEETIKWGAPVYVFEEKNLAGLGGFKNHYAIWLFQGAFLKENTSLLVNAQAGKTHSMRQIKFEAHSKVDLKEISRYIEESMNLQREGIKREPVHKPTLIIAEELNDHLQNNQDLKQSFENLTPGKQREYSEYISQAKKEETRQQRLEKIIPMIKMGKGLNDKYKA